MKEIIDITPMSEDDAFWSVMAKAYADMQAEEAKSLYVVNKQRYAEMQEAYRLLKELALECDPEAEVTCELRHPHKSTGDVEVVCYNLDVAPSFMPQFRDLIDLADNIGIWPAPNKKVSISFTFAGVMTKRT